MTSVPLPGPLRPARFLERPNRLLGRIVVEPEETTVDAQIPGGSPLRSLLSPGARVWARQEEGRWSILVVQADSGALVCLDEAPAVELVAAALAEERFEELAGFELARRNVPFGTSRFPFELTSSLGQKLCVQVEMAPAVENGVALLPEAKNPRGARQVRSLARLAEQGGAGALVVVVPRVDARLAVCAQPIDPEFADAVREAVETGIRVLVRRCQVTLEELVLGVPLELRIPGP